MNLLGLGMLHAKYGLILVFIEVHVVLSCVSPFSSDILIVPFV